MLRNGWYVENYTSQIDTYRTTGALISAAGSARVAPAPRSDYAAAAALLDDSTEEAVHELAGPALTLPQLAALLSDAAGQELPYKDVSLDEYHAEMLAAGLDEGTAGFFTALEAGTGNGDLDASTTGLELLLGRRATDPRAAFVAATEEVSWTGGFAVTG